MDRGLLATGEAGWQANVERDILGLLPCWVLDSADHGFFPSVFKPGNVPEDSDGSPLTLLQERVRRTPVLAKVASVQATVLFSLASPLIVAKM